MTNARGKKTTKKKSAGRKVLVEMAGESMAGMAMVGGLDASGFQLDSGYTPVAFGRKAGMAMDSGGDSFVVRGEVDSDEAFLALESQPGVMGVWNDAEIGPFSMEEGDADMGEGDCPIQPCDCESWVPKGNISDVAQYLGVDQVWGAGFDGSGVTIGIVDSGITAQGRPIDPADLSHPKWINKLVPNVTGGWPSNDWGTTSRAWTFHGNMSATDALGMAPGAKVYDMRISDGGSATGVVSTALAAYDWAIQEYKATGKPQILSNSWGMWQKSWASDYATNPNHPFTKKVVEAIDAGMIVLFAAGNCGKSCGGSKCGSDKGPGKSIWGANGHPKVMTVGAVNKNEEYIGYSSQGPAALDPKKPDFCGISHFSGYFNSDSGTSAATPIVAGVAALMKQGTPSANQAKIKKCLSDTAKDIGPVGWDQHSGHGIVQGKKAFDCVRKVVDIKKLLKDKVTISILDRLTISRWDKLTISILDKITLPSQDRFTHPILDKFTASILDKGGTFKNLDDVKTSYKDKNPVTDRIGSPGGPGWPGGLGGHSEGEGQKPFVLSTPHHAASAEAIDAELRGEAGMPQTMAAYAQALEELEGALAELDEAARVAAEKGAESEAELAEIQAAHGTLAEQYREIAAEFQRLSGDSQA